MAATPSHRLKLDRAEEHLLNLKGLLGPEVGERKTYPTTEAFETYQGGSGWCYRIATGYEVPERALILAGEFMFNIRSALDHLLCALIPAEDKRNAQFPIFTKDPLAKDASGKPLHRNAAGLWRRHTEGVPQAALAVLHRLQPYARAAQHRKAPEDQVLAILNVLQNADKHCQLMLIPDGLRRGQLIVDGELDRGFTAVMKNGTPVYLSDTKVHVEIEGTLAVAVGKRTDRLYPLPASFDSTLEFVTDDVLPPLEKLLPR